MIVPVRLPRAASAGGGGSADGVGCRSGDQRGGGAGPAPGEARLAGLMRGHLALKTMLERRTPQGAPPGGIASTCGARSRQPVVRTNLPGSAPAASSPSRARHRPLRTVAGHSGRFFRTQAFRIVAALASTIRAASTPSSTFLCGASGTTRCLPIRGRTEDLEIRFASSPALPKRMLAPVAFGKTRGWAR
jgi:hypothetical protein